MRYVIVLSHLGKLRIVLDQSLINNKETCRIITYIGKPPTTPPPLTFQIRVKNKVPVSPASLWMTSLDWKQQPGFMASSKYCH